MEKNSKKRHKLHVKKGDTVKVISGNAKGKTGKIVSVIVDENRAVVEGINMISKHINHLQVARTEVLKKEKHPYISVT
jgi:large subunit ribosomal protein L24